KKPRSCRKLVRLPFGARKLIELTEHAARDHLKCICAQPSSRRHLCPRLSSVAFGWRQRGIRLLHAAEMRDKSSRSTPITTHRPPPPDEDVHLCLMSRRGSKELRVLHAVSIAYIGAKAISMAARFRPVAGTVRRLRFPVRHCTTVRAEQ